MSNVTTRRAIKYGLVAVVAVAAYGLDAKIQKTEGFVVAVPGTDVSVVVPSFSASIGLSEAEAKCGMGYSCSGGGGQCGMAYNCSGQ